MTSTNARASGGTSKKEHPATDTYLDPRETNKMGAVRAFRADSIKNDATVILQGVHKLPTTEAELPTLCPEWTFVDKDAARENVLENHESIYISGVAGTGKSHFMKELVQALRDNGQNVKIVAKCHVAALNAGGGTAHAFVHKFGNGGFTSGVLVLEEVYTLETVLLHALSSRKKMGVRYIVLGCPNQHKAIGNSFNGVHCDPDMERSHWLRSLCDGNRLHLTESMRSGEGVLWDFYSSIAIGGFLLPVFVAGQVRSLADEVRCCFVLGPCFFYLRAELLPLLQVFVLLSADVRFVA